MRVVVDDRIPFIRGSLEPSADVSYMPGDHIRKEHLLDADCLIIRTRTRCTPELLEGTGVKFIATATIGFDHIDTAWCQRNGIGWTNAPGCNSGSVAQYVAAALMVLSERFQFNLKDKTIGIIGVGHVGSKIHHICKTLEMKVFLNDPPRARREGPESFTDLAVLLAQSDIVSLHVPLNHEGPDKTFHMVDSGFMKKTKPGAILINTSRGEVFDEQEVVRMLAGYRPLVVDVWENEPHINRDLMELAELATPHIAGYSLDGKWNATKMVLDAVSDHFKLPVRALPSPMSQFIPGGDPLPVITAGPGHASSTVHDVILATYNILYDDRRLRESPGTFEEQRNNYPARREFIAYAPDPFPGNETGLILKALGFKHPPLNPPT